MIWYTVVKDYDEWIIFCQDFCEDTVIAIVREDHNKRFLATVWYHDDGIAAFHRLYDDIRYTDREAAITHAIRFWETGIENHQRVRAGNRGVKDGFDLHLHIMTRKNSQ